MTTDDRRRAIGKVVSVSADRLVVELHSGNANFTVVGFDDIHYVAQMGSFIVMPAQTEYVVAEVIGLREKDLSSASQSFCNSEAMNKATSVKYLDLTPVGMLPQQRDGRFRFGVSTFPSLYTDAMYILDEELDRIFEVQDACEVIGHPISDDGPKFTRYNALSIGTSTIFKDYQVKVRIDEFFGGHSAILGNTGSGKSCTLATILQSLFKKQDKCFAMGATFLLFDINGEYRSACKELPSHIKRDYVKFEMDPLVKPVPPNSNSESTAVFRLPHWFLSVEEWELLLRASERTQQPVLRTALGLTQLFNPDSQNQLWQIGDHIFASCLLTILQGNTNLSSKIERMRAILANYKGNIDREKLNFLMECDYGKLLKPDDLYKYLSGFIKDNVSLPSYTNSPFVFKNLKEAFNLALLYEEAHGNRQIRDYCAQMITRFEWISKREEFDFLRISLEQLNSFEKNIEEFVKRYLGLLGNHESTRESQLIILDMNGASDEVVEVIAAVIARLIFDHLRKAEPRNTFPVHLILEEAHRYIAERASGYAINATRIFQRIAKEGRKYGFFLMVASQRPSELSKTVLSQCSNFVVHRIQNPDDLQHIRQMTPFISDSVIKRLPSLPKQHALIFGNAVNLPTTFKVRNVNPKPKSDDAAIRDIWFRQNKNQQ